jgi:hypothetical protein
MGGHRAKDDTWTARMGGGSDLLLWLVFAVIALYLFSRIKK